MERTFTARTELEAILLEQALVMAHELQLASDTAADGQVLAVAEVVAVRSGRELTRRALQAALAGQAEAAEEKGLPAAPAPAAVAASSRTGRRAGRRPGRAVPALDAVRLLRHGRLPAGSADRPGRLPQPGGHPAGLHGRGHLVVPARLGPARGARRPADRRRDDPTPLPQGRRGRRAARLRRGRGGRRIPHRRTFFFNWTLAWRSASYTGRAASRR